MSASQRSTPELDHEEHLHEHHGDRTGLARIPAQGGETIHCRHCSAPAPEQLVRIAGAWSVVEGTAVWDCDSCARARLHEFEAEGHALISPGR